MEEENFKYNAFISYRHNDLDKFVAESLHKQIETYKMPEAVTKKYNITDNNFRRVFRDQDELPLSSSLEDPIIEALKSSKFLIVICSPRLKESKWCKKEIENYIKFHGRENVLCVLVEGEPADSFPEILQYKEEKTITKSGKTKTIKVPCEPLAMDVRGNSKKEIYKNIKNELIRVIAPLYNLDYDDIKRRHEERELKRKANIFKIAALACLLFAIYSFFLFSRIYISSEKLKYDQSLNLAKEARESLLNDDRPNAILKSYQSITKYNNTSMPITSNGLYELTDSLGLYYVDQYFYPYSQLNTLGVVENIKRNNEKNYLLSYDTSGELVLWDLLTEKRVVTLTDTERYFYIDCYTFIGNDKFAYISDKKEVIIMDVNGNLIKKLSFNIYPSSLSSSSDGKYIEIDNSEQVFIYETTNFDLVTSFQVPKGSQMCDKRSFDQKSENFIYSYKEKYSSSSNNLKVVAYNLKSKKNISSINISSYKVYNMIFENDNLLLATEKKSGSSYDVIITKYNYKTGKIHFQKVYKNDTYDNIEINVLTPSNKTILFVGTAFSYLLDYNTGKQIRQYSFSSRVVNILPFEDEYYAVFSANGNLNRVETKNINSTFVQYNPVYTNLFNCHLSNYREFVGTKAGYLTYVSQENRIIIYNTYKNDDIKETTYEKRKFEYVKTSDAYDLAKEYNNKKKNLMNNVIYSDDKEYLFIAYKDNMVEVYKTDTKELINEIQIPDSTVFLNYYVGKTKNGEHILKGAYGYIFNKDFELIAKVPNLYDYHDEKLILYVASPEKYYEMKIYTKEEIIQKGKEYLEKNK